MRIFVAAFPPEGLAREIAATVGELVDADMGTACTPSAKLHVTLHFWGPSQEPGATAGRIAVSLRQALDACRSSPAMVRLGPVTEVLGRSTLIVPADGLDELGAVCHEAAQRVGSAPADREFRGHMTVARSRGRTPVSSLRRFAGRPCTGSWSVEEISVVASDTAAEGSRYQVIATLPVTQT